MSSNQMSKSDSSRVQSSQVRAIVLFCFFALFFDNIVDRPKAVVTCHRVVSQHGHSLPAIGTMCRPAVGKAAQAAAATTTVNLRPAELVTGKDHIVARNEELL